MRHILLASTVAATAAGFANVAKANRIDPVITVTTKAVAMPVKSSKRGSTSVYPFDQLTEVGMSFGVKNKTAAQLSSIVSNANKRALKQATDEAGKPVFKTKDATAADGSVVQVPTTEPVMIATAHFFAVDIDKSAKPADPDGANARVFRDK